ncbi:hypothetical protein AB0L47_37950 [Streptomyces bobili]|uniref:hypothetical protein n=1 Tax=Streptomyces bobili TaxID=67280 RepID=UPI00343C3E5B
MGREPRRRGFSVWVEADSAVGARVGFGQDEIVDEFLVSRLPPLDERGDDRLVEGSLTHASLVSVRCSEERLQMRSTGARGDRGDVLADLLDSTAGLAGAGLSPVIRLKVGVLGEKVQRSVRAVP